MIFLTTILAYRVHETSSFIQAEIKSIPLDTGALRALVQLHREEWTDLHVVVLLGWLISVVSSF